MLKQVLDCLGVSWDGSLHEGEPRGNFSSAEIEMVTACRRLPGNEAEFITVNLELHPDALAVKALAATPQWSSLKEFQCNLIREIRRSAYEQESDSLYFAATADNDPEQAWLIKRTEIKTRFPWPGEYR